MWIVFALLSAFFTGSIAIIVKYGQKDVPENNALALRCIVTVLLCALLIFAGYGEGDELQESRESVSLAHTLMLLGSGAFMYASQLFYYKALKQGRVSLAVSLEKLNVPLTLLGGALFFGEKIKLLGWLSLALIVLGIFGGADIKFNTSSKSREDSGKSPHGLGAFACGSLSALCGSGAVLLAKRSMDGYNGVNALALRCALVVVISLAVSKKRGELKELLRMNKEQWFFALSVGLISAVAYLCSFLALDMAQAGRSHSVEKLSAAFALLLSRLVMGERLRMREAAGVFLMSVGVLLLLL